VNHLRLGTYTENSWPDLRKSTFCSKMTRSSCTPKLEKLSVLPFRQIAKACSTKSDVSLLRRLFDGKTHLMCATQVPKVLVLPSCLHT